MEIQLLLHELRKHQLQARDKKNFEQYDKVVLNNLLICLSKYIKSIAAGANIDLNNVRTSELNQIQRALHYHIIGINKIGNMLQKILTEGCANPGSFTITNGDTIWANLPKTDLIKEFIASSIPHYGKFLAQFHTNNPEVFRSHNLIIKQAQKELSINIFHSLRTTIVKHLTSKGMYDDVRGYIHQKIQESYKETEHVSKHKDIFYHLKQKLKDTGVNIVFDILLSFKLDKLIAKQFVNYIETKTDNINENKLTLNCVELVDLAKQSKMSIDDNFYLPYITHVKTQRYKELNRLLYELHSSIFSAKKNTVDTKQTLDKILLLTPIKPSYREELKGQKKPNISKLFIQDNIRPIINKLKNLNLYHNGNRCYKCVRSIKEQMVLLKELLMYNISFIDYEISATVNKIKQSITYAELYPTSAALCQAIYDLNSIIADNTKKSIFGIKKSDMAITAENKRRELLYLLQDRINIALRSVPVPKLEQWDSFLVNEVKGPLHADAKWLNCFFAFTGIGNHARFPAQLSDQLRHLNKLEALQQSLTNLINITKNPLPKVDSKETKDNQIVGTIHIKELLNKVTLQKNQLKSFIYYLQFSAISIIINKTTRTDPNLIKAKNKLGNLIDKIRTDALYCDYNISLPCPYELINLIGYIYKIKTKNNTELHNSKNLIIVNINKLNNYFNGDEQLKEKILNKDKPKETHIEKINLLKKILLELIDFYEQKIKILFKSKKSKTQNHSHGDNNSNPTPCIDNVFSPILNKTGTFNYYKLVSVAIHDKNKITKAEVTNEAQKESSDVATEDNNKIGEITNKITLETKALKPALTV